MSVLTDLINKAKLASINTKAIVITSIVVLSLVIVIILLYRSNQTAKNEAKIETVTKEKEVTESEVKEWKDKIDDHNKESVKMQKGIIKDMKNTIKKSKPIKLPNYDNEKVYSSDTNSMLYTLLTAQPK